MDFGWQVQVCSGGHCKKFFRGDASVYDCNYADISGMVRVWAWDNPEHLTKLETFPFAGEVKDLDWDGESKKLLAVGEGNPLV